MATSEAIPERRDSGGVLAFLRHSSIEARVFLGFGLLYIALIPPGIYSIDGNSMFYVGYSLVTRGTFSIPCQFAGPGGQVHGACYSVWYPLLSIVAAPLIFVGKEIGDAAGTNPIAVAKLFALVVPALSAAGVASLTVALARLEGASGTGLLVAAVAVALGTEMLTYARTFFAETLIALLVAAAVWGLAQGKTRRTLGLIAVGLSVLAKPIMVVLGPALAVPLVAQRRELRAGLPPIVASIAGMAVYLIYNALRFGDPTQFGGSSRFQVANYAPPKLFSTLGMLLLSPGKGLIWYSPIAAVGAVMLIRYRHNRVAQLSGATALGILLGYVISPQGGADWGDRFLVPTLPLLCAPLAFVRRRRALLAIGLVIAIGFLSQVPTVLGTFERSYAELGGTNVASHRWSISLSPIVNAWPAMAHQLRDATRTDPHKLVEEAGGSGEEAVFKQGLFTVVALWWWLLPGVGIPRWLGLAVELTMIALAVVLLVKAPRVVEA
jgi:hypothetical protein